MPLFGLISNDRGITIVEVLISFIIIVIAAVGIYLGLLYADSQIHRNYHDRVAALHASGECDWQYYHMVTFREFDPFQNKSVVINPYTLSDRPPLLGTMTMEIIENSEIVEGRRVNFKTLKVRVVWNEPLTGQRSMVMQEDFFQ
jgi:hypothetical protein